jgi:hypothetical protein
MFIVVIGIMLVPTLLQNSFSIVFENNPFYSRSDAKIHIIKGYTPDGNLLIEQEYSPDIAKKKGHLLSLRSMF